MYSDKRDYEERYIPKTRSYLRFKKRDRDRREMEEEDELEMRRRLLGRTEYRHYRLRPPGRYDPRSFRTMPIGRRGRKAIVGCRKGRYDVSREECKEPMEVQSELIPKSRKGARPILGKCPTLENPNLVLVNPLKKKISRGTKLFKEFHEGTVPKTRTMKLPDMSTLVHLGQAKEIRYLPTNGSGKEGAIYRHPFKSKIQVYTNDKGNVILIKGEGLVVKKNGIYG